MFLFLLSSISCIFLLCLLLFELKIRKQFNENYIIINDKKEIIPYSDPLLDLFAGIKQIFTGNFQGKNFPKQFDYSKRDTKGLKLIQGFLLHLPIIFIWDVNHCKNIQFTNDNDIGKGKFGDIFDEIIGESIFQTHGAIWRKHKDALSPAFSWKHIQSILPQFNDIAYELSNELKQCILNNNKGIDISTWLHKATLDAIGRGGFGFNFNALTTNTIEIEQYHDFMKEINNPIHMFKNIDKILGTKKIFEKKKNNFEGFMQQLLDSKRKLFNNDKEKGINTKPKDILDFLVLASDNNTLSDRQIIHDMTTFFAAGHETTTGALTSIIHLLSRNQDIQDKLRNQINTICENDELTYEHIRKLTYLDACIKESLRLIPPSTLILRKVHHDQYIGNLLLKKDTQVVVNIYSIHRNVEYWGNNVNEFIPERFLPENKQNIPNYCYLPFALGQRQCIGNNFAQLEMKSFLSILIKNFKFLPDDNTPVPFNEYQTTIYTIAPGCTLKLFPL